MLIFLSMLESDEERRLFTDLYNQYGNMMLHVAKRYFPNAAMPDTHIAKQRIIIGKLGFFNIMTS